MLSQLRFMNADPLGTQRPLIKDSSLTIRLDHAFFDLFGKCLHQPLGIGRGLFQFF